MSFKALIIEDEPAAYRRLEKMIREADPAVEIVGILDSVSTAIRWFGENPAPDLVFLDINLGDGVSFTIFDHVDLQCPIIFTTAYDEYALKAFKLNSIDYLLKPIKQEELVFSIEKFKRQYMAGNTAIKENLAAMLEQLKQPQDRWKKRFVVNFGEKIKAIDTNHVAYFMILEKNTFLVTLSNDSYGIGYSLEQLEELLDPALFFRVNRKYIVSFSCIRNMWSYSRSRVKLQLDPLPPDEVIVSTDRSSGFKQWLDK
ncbi:MAG: LytR/AlgR family response regulator transcription factor [Bacteroidota bacterium]